MKHDNPGKFFDELTINLRKARLYPETGISRLFRHLAFEVPSKRREEWLLVVIELMMINTDIWNLESEIRQGHEDQLGLKEVGKRALLIRDKNGRRIELVNHINEIYGVQTREVKFDHASVPKDKEL